MIRQPAIIRYECASAIPSALYPIPSRHCRRSKPLPGTIHRQYRPKPRRVASSIAIRISGSRLGAKGLQMFSTRASSAGIQPFRG